MTSIPNSLLYIGIGVFLLFSCNNGPKVIEAQSSSEEITKPTGIFDLDGTAPSGTTPANQGSFTEDLHKVVVDEIIPASRYVYLKVTEAGEPFWIATRRQEITKGATYFYRGGLLKTNFESKEHNRTFEKIYLVSNLVPEKHGGNSGDLGTTVNTTNTGATIQKELIPTHTDKEVQNKGLVSIAELVAHPETYEGKKVQLSGTCVKVNPNIMNRNWIHLKDGTKDDFDLVVTSSTFVPEGKKVTLIGLVQRNRDFGAGYTYDLIVENATVVE
jgi:hypothetical protein